jgi:hypothetical protein
MKKRLDFGDSSAEPSIKKTKLIPGQTTTDQGKQAEEADYNHYTNAPYSQRYKVQPSFNTRIFSQNVAPSQSTNNAKNSSP